MSLKRVLGTILASRLAGRGRNRGPMGAASMLTGVRQRRHGSPTGKAGLAALGYMAYQAYQHRQSSGGGHASGSGGLGAMVREVVYQVTGSLGAGGTADQEPTEQQLAEDGTAAESMEEEKALLLIRAMITAAYSDGSLSDHERAHILQEIEEAGADKDDRQKLEAEMAHPKPLDDLLAQVDDQETAEEFYLASCSAVDAETDANRVYLSELRRRLDLSEDQAAEIESFV